MTKTFLTVVETIVHQRLDEQPIPIESHYQVSLTSNDDPCIRRRMMVSEEWMPLKGNWVDQCSEMLIKNETGKGAQTVPTEQESADLAAKVVEVAYVETIDNPQIEDPSRYAWQILPGRSMRASPRSLADIRIRCVNGEAECTLAVFPR